MLFLSQFALALFGVDNENKVRLLDFQFPITIFGKELENENVGKEGAVLLITHYITIRSDS